MGRGKLDLPDEHTMVVNLSNPVIRNLLALKEQGRDADAALIVAQVYDLAMLSHRGFDRERMEAFLERSNRILAMLGKE